MKRRRTMIVTAVTAVAASVAAAAALAETSVKDYVVPVGDEHEVDALFSVGDQVPWSGGSGQYRMVGIPDGLGAHPNGDGTSTLYMNSEFPTAPILTLSEPLVGGAKNRGAIVSKWILDADEAQLEAAGDAVGAFRFARPEDGAFNKKNRDNYLFATTGGAAGVNELGRLYSLDLHPGNVTQGGTLTIAYDADSIIEAGGDIAISPDNIDVSDDYLMINEDGTESRLVMTAKNRDGSIWRFDLERSGVDVSSRIRIAELDPPGRDGLPVRPGVWETSGIIDVSSIFGPNTWLSDVQAHPPTAAPGGTTVTVEDGQLFILKPKS